MSDYTFEFNDDDVKVLNEQAAQYQKEYKESGGEGGDYPMAIFMRDGHHTLRVYPDRDARGNARLIRRVFMHSQVPIGEKDTVRCWADERVDKMLGDAFENGLKWLNNKETWKYKSRELGILCGHFFESSDPENHPIGQTCLVILDRRQMFAVQDFIAELHPEEARRLLNPTADAPGIRISITKGQGKANVSVGVSGMRTFRLPLPPMLIKSDKKSFVPFKSLTDLFIQESAKITEEEFNKFRLYIDEMTARARAEQGAIQQDTSSKAFQFENNQPAQQITHQTQGNGAGGAGGGAQVSPNPGSNGANYQQPSPGANTPQMGTNPTTLPDKSQPIAHTPGTDAFPCPLAQKIQARPEMVNTYGPDVRFGNHPGTSNPYCMVCDVEDECRIQTQKNRQATPAAA